MSGQLLAVFVDRHETLEAMRDKARSPRTEERLSVGVEAKNTAEVRELGYQMKRLLLEQGSRATEQKVEVGALWSDSVRVSGELTSVRVNEAHVDVFCKVQNPI